MAGIQFSVAPQLPARLTGVAPVSVTKSGLSYSISLAGYLINRVNQALPPTVNDDATDGFDYGSRWVMTTGVEYVCTNPTTGAAVWVVVGADSFADLTGNIAVGQMAGGVNASATTFWAGDGSWKPLPVSISGTPQQLFTILDSRTHQITNQQIYFPDYVDSGDTDATAAFLRIAALPAGPLKIFVPAGTYEISAHVAFGQRQIKMEGCGDDRTIIRRTGVVAATDTFSFEGTQGSSVALTADAVIRATTVTVGSTATFTADQYAIVSDGVDIDPGGNTGKSGELVQIKTVDSTTQLTLYSGLYGSQSAIQSGGAPGDYTVANSATITPLAMVGPSTIMDIGFEGEAADAPANMVRFERIIKPKLIRCSVGLSGRGFMLKDCFGALVDGCSGEEMVFNALTGANAYTVNIEGACAETTITNGFFRRVRHGVTTVGTALGVAHGITISNNTALDCTNSGLDTHPGADGVEFIGNRVRYCTTGISYRGINTKISSNQIQDCTSFGVSGGTKTNYNIDIDGNTVTRTGSHGIIQDTAVTGYSVRNNKLFLIGSDGIRVPVGAGAYTSTAVTIKGNEIRGVGMAEATRNGILVGSGSAAVAGAIIDDNIVDVFGGSGNVGITCSAPTASSISNNTVKGTWAAAYSLGANTSTNNITL